MVKVVRLPSKSDGSKQGVDDFLAAGTTVDDLLGLSEEYSSVGSKDLTWPVMAEEAFHGLAGEIVRAVEPTEHRIRPRRALGGLSGEPPENVIDTLHLSQVARAGEWKVKEDGGWERKKHSLMDVREWITYREAQVFSGLGRTSLSKLVSFSTSGGRYLVLPKTP